MAAAMMVSLGYVIITVLGFLFSVLGGIFSSVLVMIGILISAGLGLDKVIKSGLISEWFSLVTIVAISLGLMFLDILRIYRCITFGTYIPSDELKHNDPD